MRFLLPLALGAGAYLYFRRARPLKETAENSYLELTRVQVLKVDASPRVKIGLRLINPAGGRVRIKAVNLLGTASGETVFFGNGNGFEVSGEVTNFSLIGRVNLGALTTTILEGNQINLQTTLETAAGRLILNKTIDPPQI